MPNPRAGEDEKDYVSRFMASQEARHDFPDETQRAAVAFSKFREKKNAHLFKCPKCGSADTQGGVNPEKAGELGCKACGNRFMDYEAKMNAYNDLCRACGASSPVNADGVVNDCLYCGDRVLGRPTPAVEDLNNLCRACHHAIAPEHDSFGCQIPGCGCGITDIDAAAQIQAVLPNAGERSNGSAECNECHQPMTADGKGGWTGHAAGCSTAEKKNAEPGGRLPWMEDANIDWDGAAPEAREAMLKQHSIAGAHDVMSAQKWSVLPAYARKSLMELGAVKPNSLDNAQDVCLCGHEKAQHDENGIGERSSCLTCFDVAKCAHFRAGGERANASSPKVGDECPRCKERGIQAPHNFGQGQVGPMCEFCGDEVNERKNAVDIDLAGRIWGLGTSADRGEWIAAIGLGADTASKDWDAIEAETKTALLALFDSMSNKTAERVNVAKRAAFHFQTEDEASKAEAEWAAKGFKILKPTHPEGNVFLFEYETKENAGDVMKKTMSKSEFEARQHKKINPEYAVESESGDHYVYDKRFEHWALWKKGGGQMQNDGGAIAQTSLGHQQPTSTTAAKPGDKDDEKQNAGRTTRDGKTIDEVSVELTGKKYGQLPDDGAEQDHVMHEFEKRGGVAQQAFQNAKDGQSACPRSYSEEHVFMPTSDENVQKCDLCGKTRNKVAGTLGKWTENQNGYSWASEYDPMPADMRRTWLDKIGAPAGLESMTLAKLPGDVRAKLEAKLKEVLLGNSENRNSFNVHCDICDELTPHEGGETKRKCTKCGTPFVFEVNKWVPAGERANSAPDLSFDREAAGAARYGGRA